MKKRIVTLLLCIVLCVAAFAGCSQQPQEAATPAESTPATPSATQAPSSPEASQPAASAQPEGSSIEDMSGTQVTIQKADKIVSLTPAGTEIVFALGGQDRLIGVDAYSNYPEQAQALEIVGDFNGPDVEKVAALEPDVVLAGNGLQQEAIDQLKQMGIAVASVEATTFEDIPKAITLVAEILGTDDARQQAQHFNDDIDAAVQKAKENAPEEAPTVYYAMSYGDQGNWTSGPGSFINTMIELAGGKCVTQDAEYAWVEYPVEDLAAANPDIILVDSSMGSTGDIASAQGYSGLDAVKDGKVYSVDADVFTRPGPRIAQAIAEVSEILNK